MITERYKGFVIEIDEEDEGWFYKIYEDDEEEPALEAEYGFADKAIALWVARRSIDEGNL